MKIAVIGTRGFPGVQGGVETHCERLYTRLAQAGCDITVFTRVPYVDPSIHNYKGVSLVPVSSPRRKHLEAIVHSFKSLWLARKLKPDILHVHAIGPALLAPLGRLLGMKVVVTHHGPDYKREKWGYIAKEFLKLSEKAGVRFANEVIAISKNIADDIKTKYNRIVRIIPNGIDIPQPVKTNNFLNKLGIEKGRYILAVGRFVPEKGFGDLIDAFSSVKELNGWKLVIVGSADHRDKYSSNIIRRASTNSDIILTGLLKGEPLEELYTHAGLFVLPSYYEGLPIVLLEAMSYGLSCLVSDMPANKIGEIDNSRFFTPGDVETLSKMITKFMGKPLEEDDKRRQISIMHERYSWAWIAEETLKVYKSLMPMPEKLKVVVIGARGFPSVQGGVEKYCEEIYKRLIQNDKLEIIAMVISKYYENKVKEWNGIRFVYINSLDSKYLEKIYYGLKASALTIIEKPDIAHFHGLSCGIYIPLLRLFGIKTLVTFQSRDYLYPKWNRMAKIGWKISERAVIKWSDKIIAVAKPLEEYLKGRTKNAIRIPNGVDISHLNISPDEEKHYLQKYRLEKGEYIFFAGRFTPEKAIHDLINAFNALDEKSLKLVIAGDADHEDKYSRMIKTLAKESRDVALTGFITGKELQVLFSNARLFVLPSKFEGLPHVLLEAMNFGVEVLASDIEANLQVGLNAKNYFKQGDIIDLKDKITHLLKSKLSEEEISRRRNMLKHEYNWDEISQRINKVYCEIVGLYA